MGGVKVQSGPNQQVIGIAARPTKTRAINALVTDETTAQAILTDF